MRGLKNLGNTCYFNVAVQLLSHVPTVANYFAKNDYTGLCAITFEYQKVLRQLIMKDVTEPVDPTELLGAFREIFPEFKENRQHDTQEVILILVSVFERSIGICVFNGVENGSPMTTHIVHVTEPGHLSDFLENHKVTVWPKVISFTFSMYDHKFPITVPFEFEGRGLFAIVMHKGFTEAGHYALLVKVKDKWYIKEDEKVWEIPCGIAEMRGDWYMAFYRP
jgi:ubiquitin C-terminal hydrolase